MPAYAAYLSGRTTTDEPSRTPLLANGIAFVLGFSIVFVVLFYVLTAFEVTLFSTHRREINLVAGIVVIVLALQTMGVLRFAFLLRERRLHALPAVGLVGSFLLGVTFAAGWTPCIGPQLGAILQVAADGGLGGLPVMIVYCLGLAIPFLLVAGLADRLQGTLRAINRNLGAINLVAGFLLLVFGLLLVTDRLTVLSHFSFSSPFDL
jgi:cytochrome c-type biogenesis protein